MAHGTRAAMVAVTFQPIQIARFEIVVALSFREVGVEGLLHHNPWQLTADVQQGLTIAPSISTTRAPSSNSPQCTPSIIKMRLP